MTIQNARRLAPFLSVISELDTLHPSRRYRRFDSNRLHCVAKAVNGQAGNEKPELRLRLFKITDRHLLAENQRRTFGIDMHGIAGHEFARQYFIGQGIFEQALDGSFQGPRTIHRIESL